MTGLGFDPERTATLSVHVTSAIEELDAITSTDPAALDALRVVSLTGHNLRTSWLPLLERIAATDALASWTRSGLGGGPSLWGMPLHRHVDGLVAAAILLQLRKRAGAIRHDIDGHPVGDDATGPWLAPLLAAVRGCLAADPEFRTRLLELVSVDPSVAWLFLSDELDPALRADVLVALLGTIGRVHCMEWQNIAAAADLLMEGLVDHPAEALRVLGHRDTSWWLAEWPATDQTVVAEFFHAGLATAVRDDPALHPDGVEVLVSLIDLANQDRMDRVGFLSGASVGLASSIGAYTPSFVDTVRLEAGTVSVRSGGVDSELDTTLGTYAELADFFGAILRAEPAAQEVLGAELAAMARLAVNEGDGVPATVRVDTVAELAQLLQHAADNEHAENRLAGAAQRAGALDSSTLFGFTTTALFLVAKSGHPITMFVLDRGVKDLVDLAVRPRPGPPPIATDLATATHQVIVTAAVGRAAGDPAFRKAAGIGGSSPQWSRIESRLAALEEDAAEGDDPAGIDRAVHQLEADARELGAGDHLDELLRRPAVHDLTSAGSADR